MPQKVFLSNKKLTYADIADKYGVSKTGLSCALTQDVRNL